MHGTGSVLRSVATVASAATQPASRIPHLRFHIGLRRAQVEQHKDARCKERLITKRCQSTYATADYLDRTHDTSEAYDDGLYQKTATAATKQQAERDLPITSVEDITTQLKNSNMFDILEQGCRDRVISGLMNNSIGTPFIQQVPDAIFNKALLTLDPEYFIEPFKKVSRHLKGRRNGNPLQMRTIDHRLSTFAFYLDRIVVLRRESGNRLNLEACNHLLRCAGSLGDRKLADSVFKVIMPEDEVEPTIQSYNYYSQALLWSNSFGSTESYGLRVLPKVLEIRASRHPPESLSGHKTKSRMAGVKGVRQEILDVFKQCSEKQLAPDEFMFTNLMISMGREADLDSVKSVLKSVWNIDVDLLEAYDEEEVESPTFYEIDHPLRPSEDLLFAVAHVFGSNNDIRTGWLLVDFISRNYDLRVSERVWHQLCEWAFVLSLRRTPAEQRQQKDQGQVSQSSFIRFVDTMTDEPHNVKPDAFIHWLLSRSWRDVKQLDNTLHHTQTLKDMADQQHIRMRGLVDEVLDFARTAQAAQEINAFDSDQFHNLRRRYTMAFLEFQRTLQLTNTAVARNLWTVKWWPGSGKLLDFERRRLPHIIDTFAGYLPEHVTYRTKTGEVELDTGYKQRAKSYETHKLDYRILPRILNAMDTEDSPKVAQRMRMLPDIVLKTKRYCINCETVGHTHDQCRHHANRSKTLDYLGETGHLKAQSKDDYYFVLNPATSQKAVPYGFEPGAEGEYAQPKLPFQP